MSFFEDQEDDWLANNCKGDPANYDGAGNFVPNDMGPAYRPDSKPVKSKSRKRREQRKRAHQRDSNPEERNDQ